MSHDTSRHTIRTRVICHLCKRELSGAANLAGRWTVRRHKDPDGKPCWGHLNTDHRPVPEATP